MLDFTKHFFTLRGRGAVFPGLNVERKRIDNYRRGLMDPKWARLHRRKLSRRVMLALQLGREAIEQAVDSGAMTRRDALHIYRRGYKACFDLSAALPTQKNLSKEIRTELFGLGREAAKDSNRLKHAENSSDPFARAYHRRLMSRFVSSHLHYARITIEETITRDGVTRQKAIRVFNDGYKDGLRPIPSVPPEGCPPWESQSPGPAAAQ